MGGGACSPAGHFRVAGTPDSHDVSTGGGDRWRDVTEVWLPNLDADGYAESIFLQDSNTGWLSMTVDSDHYVFFKITDIAQGVCGGDLLFVAWENHVGNIFSANDLVTFEIIPSDPA